MQDARWGFRKLTSDNYPILGAAVSASTQQRTYELKNFEQTGVLSRLRIRLVGNIIVAGAGAGTATGRDNPEALLTNVIMKTTPDLGVQIIDNVSARGLLRQAAFERGYLIKAAAVPDVAATVAVDIQYEINFRKAAAIKPVEFSLPMAFFSSIQLQLTFGGRDQLFSGGTNTFDLSGLQLQIWAKYDRNVAGTFHLTCFNERSFPAITATQADFQLQNIPAGFVYTDMLLRGERDNVLVNNLLNSWTLQSAGRIWLPQGDVNALEIQADNRDDLVDPAFNQTGLYWVNGMKDGYLTNAIDSQDAMLDLKADVTRTSGTEILTLVSKRCKPNALSVEGIASTGAVNS